MIQQYNILLEFKAPNSDVCGVTFFRVHGSAVIHLHKGYRKFINVCEGFILANFATIFKSQNLILRKQFMYLDN